MLLNSRLSPKRFGIFFLFGAILDQVRVDILLVVGILLLVLLEMLLLLLMNLLHVSTLVLNKLLVKGFLMSAENRFDYGVLSVRDLFLNCSECLLVALISK